MNFTRDLYNNIKRKLETSKEKSCSRHASFKSLHFFLNLENIKPPPKFFSKKGNCNSFTCRPLNLFLFLSEYSSFQLQMHVLIA